MVRDRKISKKVKRLVKAQRQLLFVMGNHLDLETFNTIDESFHLQKVAELEFLLERIEELSTRLNAFNCRLADEYKTAYSRWNKDAHWLNSKLTTASLKN